MQETLSKAKARYLSRRGMLELDRLLIPFVDNYFTQLSVAQISSYEKLLQVSDPELWAWLSGNEEPAESEFVALVNLIRQHADG